MAKLRGLDDVKKDVLTEALSQAIQWIDSGDLDLAKGTLLAMIDIFGNKIENVDKTHDAGVRMNR